MVRCQRASLSFCLVTSLHGFALPRAVLRLSVLLALPAASHLVYSAALYALLHHSLACQLWSCSWKLSLHVSWLRVLCTRRTLTG